MPVKRASAMLSGPPREAAAANIERPMEQEQRDFLEDMRSRLTAEAEDDVANFLTPNRPSQLRALTDDELFRMLHKVAFANDWKIDTKIQFEATARLIAALKDFKRSSDRAALALVVLTLVCSSS
jgi:hypothetical protein